MAINADVAEKLMSDDKLVSNAEGAVKEKRGIHIHTYSSPYVYHSPIVHTPVVYHAPIIQHSAPIIQHSIVAHPVISHSVVSHAPLVALHHFKRR